MISCIADYAGGDAVLQEGEMDAHAWVNLEETKNYELIDGIYDELAMAEAKRTGKRSEWARAARTSA